MEYGSDLLIDAYLGGKKILDRLPDLVQEAVKKGEPRRDAVYRLLTPDLESLRRGMTSEELVEDIEHERITEQWRAQHAAAHPDESADATPQ